MRNVIVTIIALAIVAGVLAKNPPASAPTLAAATASLPLRTEKPLPGRIVEPIRSTPVVEPATVADPKTEEPVTTTTEELPTAATGTKATQSDSVIEATVPVRSDYEAVFLKTSRKADEPQGKQIDGSSVAPKTAVLATSPTTRGFSAETEAKQTTNLTDVSAAELSMGNTASAPRSPRTVSTRTRSDIDILLSPEASAAQTLAVASALRFSAGLPTRRMLKERADEINLKSSSRASDRSAHTPTTVTGSMNAALTDSIKAISEPLPVSPIADIRTAKRVKSESKHIVTVAEPTDQAPVKAIMPPMFVVADTIRRPVATAAAPLKNTVFTINIDEKPQPALKNSTATAMPVKVDAVKAAPVKTAAPTVMKKSAASVPASFSLNLQNGGYCDSNFVGPTITFAQTAELTLDDLLYQIHNRFGVNFLMGPEVGKRPVNIKSGSIPWNTLLRSQLFISGIRARCIDGNTIELIANSALPTLQDMADVKTRFVKLKFLQRTSGGTVDLANRSQGGQGGEGGGCGGGSGGQSGGIQSGGQGGQGGQGQTAGQQGSNKFDKLIVEIEKIIGIRSMSESSVGSGGGQGAGGQQQTDERRTNRFVTQIPGRNILAIRATEEEHALIDQIILRADRPPFQVIVKGLVYTANQDRLRDIGVQTTITEAAGRTTGGILGHTLGSTGTLFDFSTIIGTFDFNVQATAFQQNGVISVKSRPFATVLDGLCTTLNVGRELPIVIDSSLGGQGDVVFVNAANNLAVTPYVIDDENGNPMAVTLELRLDANDIDSSVTARGVPAISRRSIQTQLLLGEDRTAILGGFTVDSDSRSVSKTPGLGDIPIIGELFKRRVRDTRVNRLYFAISVSVVPFGEAIRPVDVPGADPQPPSITPEMKQRGDKAEPVQVVGPGKTGP
jgi:uncharacterized membrane protein YgcG